MSHTHLPECPHCVLRHHIDRATDVITSRHEPTCVLVQARKAEEKTT